MSNSVLNTNHLKSNQRILLVDDNDEVRNHNARALADSGYHIDTAENAVIAWKALKSNHYDLLITDNTMPGVTGLELIRQLRSEDISLPIILASGTAPAEELNRSPWLEVSALLTKPYTSSELLITVEYVLRMTESGQ